MHAEPTANHRSVSDREELTVLAAVAAALALSRLVTPVKPDAPLTLRGRELPSVCLIRHVTGRPCLSCGLTRGVAFLARGNVRGAVRANPLSPIAAALAVGRALVALWRLVGHRLPIRRAALARRRPRPQA
jgi:hypothetical protein